MPGWMKHKLESRFLGEIINNFRYADDSILMAEREEELKRLLMRVKEKSEKTGLKNDHGIQSHHFMANRRGESGTMTFYFLGLQNHFSHVMKSHLLLETKSDKPRQCAKQQRCHFTDKGSYIQSYSFPSRHV